MTDASKRTAMDLSVDEQVAEQRSAPSDRVEAAPVAPSATMFRNRLACHVLEVADQRTRPARRRAGLGEFLLGDAAATDRLLARLYFALAARRWASDQHSADRLEVLRAGLSAVPGTPVRIVELGCGAGAACREAATRWPESEVRGYDVSGPMIRAARRTAESGSVKFFRRSARDVDESADLVFACNYLPFPPTVRRMLRSGGHVLAISSFQRRSGGTVPAHWTSHGFRAVSASNVGEGCFELYQAAD